MKSDRYDELDYLIGFTVCEKMYNESVISFETFCRINRAMARTVGVPSSKISCALRLNPAYS